jgi:hypothetical protein
LRNILVIEDSPLVLKILEHMFRKETGFQPIFCATMDEASGDAGNLGAAVLRGDRRPQLARCPRR